MWRLNRARLREKKDSVFAPHHQFFVLPVPVDRVTSGFLKSRFFALVGS